jgi:hypothetical protein
MYQRNTGFDATLVAPSPEALTEEVSRATKAANLRCRSALVQLSPKEGEGLGRAIATTTEGFRQWLGAAAGPRRDDHRSAVAVAWWTDGLGRRHVRIKGARWSFTYAPEGVSNTLSPYPQPHPPLGMIYPEFVYLAGTGASERLLVACPCGEAGTPEEIGWVGERCAACHDGREEGQTTPDPVPLFTPPHQSWSSLGNPMSFSADGNRLARVTNDGVVLIHHLENGETSQWQLKRSEWDSLLDAGDLAFLPDGRTLALNGHEAVILLDVQTGERTEGPPAGPYLRRLAMGADGNLVTSSRDRCAVWDLRTNDPVFVISSRDGGPEVLCAAFSPDGSRLALGCEDGTTLVWDAAARREVAQWGGGPQSGGGIQEIAVSPDGRHLATLADDEENNLLLRDFRKGTIQATWTLDRQGYHPRSWLRLIAFSPDSRTLAASERDGVLKFYDVAGGPTVSLVSAPKPEVMALAFQPTGRWLATTGAGDWIKLWPWAELLAAARRQTQRPPTRKATPASSGKRKSRRTNPRPTSQ